MARGISVLITGSAAPLRKALRDADNQLGGFAKASVATMAAAGAASAAFAASAIKAAAADQQQQALLARQLQATTGATEAQVAAVERLISATQTAAGVSDTELRQAFAALTVGTRDLATSQDVLNVAIDVAAATGKSTVAVAQSLAKAYQGNTRSLAQLSPELRTAVQSGAEFSDILNILRDNFGGAAAAAADTFQGRVRRLAIAADEAKESIGVALLPAVEQLVPKLIAVAEWAGQNGPLLGKVALAVGSFATALLAANVALGAWRVIAAATVAINAALGTSFLAVQVATGVGIATAVAAVGTYMTLKNTFDDLKPSTDNFTSALNGNTVALGENTYGLNAQQYALATYIGPLNAATAAERDNLYQVLESRKAAAAYRAELERKRLAQQTAAATTANATTKQEALTKRLRDAKKAIRDYVAGIRDAITSSVSLSTAFSEATSQEEARTTGINDALKARREAYAALQQAQATGDAKAYGAALENVAAAESRVTEAQAVKPKDYRAIFAEQITAAKAFAGYVKQLAAAGLSKAGLAQILDLGPVAGAQVAKDLLSGTGGMSISSLDADLADISAAGTAAGMAIPGFQAALGATVGGTANAPTIIIQTGVGDPVAIGKEVAGVLNAYGAKTGGVPVVTKKPKTRPKQRPSKSKTG